MAEWFDPTWLLVAIVLLTAAAILEFVANDDHDDWRSR